MVRLSRERRRPNVPVDRGHARFLRVCVRDNGVPRFLIAVFPVLHTGSDPQTYHYLSPGERYRHLA